MQNNKPKKNIIKKLIIGIIAVIALSVTGFFIYVADYYHADQAALDILKENQNIEIKDNLTILYPEVPGDTALIFYPGAKVESLAYLPILDKIRDKGITCILVEMPFNLAIFDSDASEEIYQKLPEIKNWYIGGHSMGGAMASSYAAKNQDKVKGLILLGAYIYGDYPVSKTLTIYGSFNNNLEKNIDYTENVVVIQGGNHAKFGNYGAQKGDPEGTITTEEQQNIAVDNIVDFVK